MFVVMMCFDLLGFSSFENQTNNGFLSGHLKTFLPQQEGQKLGEILAQENKAPFDPRPIEEAYANLDRVLVETNSPPMIVLTTAQVAAENVSHGFYLGLLATVAVAAGGFVVAIFLENFNHNVQGNFWDIPEQLSNPVFTSMRAIINFHGEMLFYLIFIAVFVLFMLLRTVFLFSSPVRSYKKYYDRLSNNVLLEII
jgi:hypothetical protein